MANGGIPDDVARFIAEHVDSVELLEVLLLLRAEARKEWTAETVARELRISPVSAGVRLRTLAAQELLSAKDDGLYLYAPTSGALDMTVRHLAACYAERRVAVITAIFSRPSDTVRIFADAFRIRKKD